MAYVSESSVEASAIGFTFPRSASVGPLRLRIVSGESAPSSVSFRSPPVICTSWPISRKMTHMPVSWQMATFSSRAMA